MQRKRLFESVLFVIAAVGCQGAPEPDWAGEATASIGTTGVIPDDAACTHIIATRLADFAVSEYQGALSGGVFSVLPGETQVTATAYPGPCNAESTQPPWLADVQTTTFSSGPNTLMLHFRDNTSVTIDPTFDDNTAPEIVIRPGSPVRTGRNGEDASGPDYSLDGWDIKRIALPPAVPGESFVLSTRVDGGPPYSPRGLAALPDGTFAVQVGEASSPVWLFASTGALLETWPVVYPGTAIRFDSTDGIEAIDATHFVRTGALAQPIHCDTDGAHCVGSGLDLLELVTTLDGARELHVTRQIVLPELADQPLNLDYPVGVTPIGDRFAVASIPGDGSPQVLTLINADGSVAAGPTPVTGDLEGLFVSGDGRLGALDYHGNLTMHDPATLAARPGETASYRTGIDLSTVRSLAWDSAAGQLLALTLERRLAFVSPAFDAATDVDIDLSGYFNPSGIEYRPDTNQLVLADRIPPIDPDTGRRIPAVDLYDLVSKTLTATITLRDTALPARTVSVAYDPTRQHFVSHYIRPNGVVDPAVDSVAYVHRLDGSLAGSFDLAPFGVARILSVRYLPAGDELVFGVRDTAGIARLVVTSPGGHPKRSYRLDAIGDQITVAPITSGPAAGDLGAAENQPSNLFQISLQ